MGENYTTTTLSPTRIYYLSLVDPTSCFSQRYFLKHCAKVCCYTPIPTRKEVAAFTSLINSTLLTFARRHLLYTEYIGNLYQPLVLWLISSEIPQEHCSQFQMLLDVLHTLLLSAHSLRHEHCQTQ